jgi:lysyl-tRNA synthetase class 1
MYNQPQRARRLYFDVIPRAVDEYLANAARLVTQPEAERPANPAWHIHAGRLPNHSGSPVSFAMLLNLASVVNAETPAMLWGFIQRYSPGASPETMPFLDKLVDYAIVYYRDFVRPQKHFRHPTEVERAALADLAEALRGLDVAAVPGADSAEVQSAGADSAEVQSAGAGASGVDAEAIQNIVYAVGNRHPFPELRAWFGCLYQVLLGQQEGPRFGGFVALYGVAETIALIEAALARPASANVPTGDVPTGDVPAGDVPAGDVCAGSA